jgi:hypothetical protein
MGHTVFFLMLTLVMPHELPDKVYKLKMDSMEQCQTESKAFMDNGLTKKMEEDGVIAIMAGCLSDRKKDEGNT